MICRMIIADPDQSHAEALAAYLERLDYETTVAVSAEQLQTLFAENSPDLVLVDAGLIKDGLDEFLIEMKRRRPLTQLIVLFHPEILDHALASPQKNVFGFIPKPVKSLVLEHLLLQARQTIALLSQLDRTQQELQDLRHTQKRYRQLFDEMPCYLSVQNRDLRITASNRLFKAHFGDEIGCHCYQVYKHRDAPCRECPVVATFEDGEAHQTEEVVTSKTGTPYNVLTWTAPIRDPGGRIIQVMEMATDITKIRKLQDHLTSLGLMIGSMSHGVKGMLTALDGAVYQLESGLARNDGSRIASAVGETREMVDRINTMVLQILFYAKSRELNYEIVALTDLNAAIESGVRPMAIKNGVALDLSLAPNLGAIEIDSHWMQIALINLVENAIDACVDTPDPNRKEVAIRFGPDGDKGILIEVRDNGKGMDQETREKVFTLFFSSKGSKGTGLGLFIAHHVVTLHGGSIQVDSAPGKGTCFEIRLPRAVQVIKPAPWPTHPGLCI